MTSGPDDRSTGTIKFGKDFDAPWFVASGNPAEIRRQLLEFAGREDDPEQSLQQLMVEVAVDTQAAWVMRSKLGAQEVTSTKRSRPAAASEPAEPKAEENPNAFLFDLLNEAADLNALKVVFLKNKDAFNTDKALQALFNERKNALS